MADYFDYYFRMIQVLIALQRPKTLKDLAKQLNLKLPTLRDILRNLRIKKYVVAIPDGLRNYYVAKVKVHRVAFSDDDFKQLMKLAKQEDSSKNFYLKKLNDLYIYRYRDDRIFISDFKEFYAFKKKDWQIWKAYIIR